MPDPSSTIRCVRVELGARSYDILAGSGALAQLGERLSEKLKRPRVFVLSDETVAGLHLDVLSGALKTSGIELLTRTVPPGEQTKSLDELNATLNWLFEAGADRGDYLLAFGGGVIGDLAGFAASVMKRGMGFIQVPTTLLAQVDSSVGGKTAVNSPHGKNLIGQFYQPSLVIADSDLLKTLPEREIRAGYAEVVKYGLISDPEFFDWLEVNGADVLALKPDAIAEAVARSCQAKADIVAQDEREGGIRALLNLGHTFGHALEAANKYGPQLLHGEAVGCGMAMALRYSQRMGLAHGQDVQRTESLLNASGLKTRIQNLDGGPYPSAFLVDAMRQDKKARAGRVPLILTRGIGRAFIQPDADLSDVQSFLEEETTGL